MQVDQPCELIAETSAYSLKGCNCTVATWSGRHPTCMHSVRHMPRLDRPLAARLHPRKPSTYAFRAQKFWLVSQAGVFTGPNSVVVKSCRYRNTARGRSLRQRCLRCRCESQGEGEQAQTDTDVSRRAEMCLPSPGCCMWGPRAGPKFPAGSRKHMVSCGTHSRYAKACSGESCSVTHGYELRQSR